MHDNHVTDQAAEPPKRWLTVADVADELDVSSRTVLRWIQAGRLPAVVLPGGRTRVSRHTFDEWLAALPPAGKSRRGDQVDAGRMGRA